MLSALPFVTVPTWQVELPLFGPHPISIFGVTATLGVVVGFRSVLRYARERGLDEPSTDRLTLGVLLGGFAMAHWVSVLLYFPERVAADPWILLAFHNGISSVGGFVGGALTFAWLCWRRRLAVLAHADAIAFGLLAGFTIGRIGCALVHDHPGAIATGMLAVGPWPDGLHRYDLGLIELAGLLVLCFVVYRVFDWRRAAHGRLTALIVIAYGVGRFPLDFLRADDLRYAGLTPAQFASLGFILAGALLWRRLRGH